MRLRLPSSRSCTRRRRGRAASCRLLRPGTLPRRCDGGRPATTRADATSPLARRRSGSSGSSQATDELGSKPLRGVMSSPQPAIGIGRHERHARAAWTRDGFRYHLGRNHSQGARRPRSFHAATRRRTGSSYSTAARALTNASLRPVHSAQRRTGQAVGAPQRSQRGGADVAQGRPAACAHLRARAGADETALGQQQVEHPATVELRACRDCSSSWTGSALYGEYSVRSEDHAAARMRLSASRSCVASPMSYQSPSKRYA